MRVEKYQFQAFEQIESVSLGGFQRTPGGMGGYSLQEFSEAPAQPDQPPPHIPAEDLPTFTERQAHHMKDEAYGRGYQEGKNAALVEAKTDTQQQLAAAVSAHEQQVASALDTIATQITAMAVARENALQNSMCETARLAMTMAQKIAGQALNKHSTKAIEPHIIEALTALHGETEAAVIVAPDMAAPVQEMLDKLAGMANFRGTVVVETDSNMQPGDCRVEWERGEAVRNTEKLLQEVAAIVERYCSAEEIALAARSEAPEFGELGDNGTMQE